MRKLLRELREKALFRRLRAKYTHVELRYHNESELWEVRFGPSPNDCSSCWNKTKLSALEDAVAIAGA